ncbi:MAG: thiamine pyrophosphate-binding protein [Methanobrevibacter sp.]|nr:thiamine pyrophosphate-binding protein [Methanobrevibacter sp.]
MNIMNAAEILVNLLERDGNEFIFGHPGEQILPFYKALKDSSITHVLTRHEQAAAHAADAYARSSGEYGICISTAGPGAMNLVMGVSVAFKDSVPMLVITGDNDYSTKDSDIFQSFPINSIFENITVKTFHPNDGKTAVYNLIEALIILHKFPKGPVHINLSRDVLLEDINLESIDLEKVDLSNFNLEFLNTDGSDCFEIRNIDNISDNLNDFSQIISSNVDASIQLAIKKLQVSEKPLVIVGNGIVWSKAIDKLNDFLTKTGLPIATTYHSKGIVSEDDKLNLGIVGIRGNSLSNYAYENSDCILVLGAKLSERTIGGSDFDIAQEKMIHVNIDKNCIKGNINLCMDVSKFLDSLLSAIDQDEDGFKCNGDWLDEIYSHYEELIIDGIDDVEENFNPLRPPYAINKIVNGFEGSYFLSDAGTHTTWTTLLVKNDSFGKLLFSGGFGPMGYGLPAAIGVAFALKKANKDDNVVVICGDGDIQMVIQELATIKEYDLNINVFIIDNSELGIIRQWEETIYDFDKYQVDLANPDFAKLANAYGIYSMKVESKEDLELAIDKSLNSNKAFLADVCVCEENIPLPK